MRRLGVAMGTASALCVALAACTSAPDGGAERGAGWDDDGGQPVARDAGDAGDGNKPPRVPNVDAVLKGECATASAPSKLLPVNLLFTLDRSSSMACNPPPTTDSVACEANPVRAKAKEPTKWEVTRTALADAIQLLPAQTVVGLAYFSNDDACGVHSTPSVPLAPLSGAQTSLVEASLAAVAPGGSTPLVGATVLAYKHLYTEAVSGRVRGRTFVVLITDGEQSESCSDPARCDGQAQCTRVLVDEEVPKAAAAGIGTFVIGVPGSELARETLSRIALAGGTASASCQAERGECHFDMTRDRDFGSSLREALSEISGRVVRCEFPVPRFDDAAVDLDRINIVYTPGKGDRRVIPRDDRGACDGRADGWQYNEDDTGIRLCGASCEQVRGDPDARLDVVLGCPVIGPI